MAIDPEKLREIASYLDSFDAIMINIWATSADPRREEAIAFLQSREMQGDLRAWADELEAI